jgi:cobalamin biosynthesis protein CobC
MISHGGALDEAVSKYGGTRDSWLDFSTGINPSSIEIPDFSPQLWQKLPDTNLEQATIEAARRFYNVPINAGIVAASGSQAFIQLYPYLIQSKNAVVLGPTYEEHAHVLGLSGKNVRYENTFKAIEFNDKIVVVVNPNNPDGRVISVDALLFMASTLSQRGGILVVDEAFCDCDPAASVAPFAGMEGLLVLKSFGKFFGVPGARLGFAIGAPSVIDFLTAMIGPWAVSSPALALACHAFNNSEAIDLIRVQLKNQRTVTENILTKSGLHLVGGTDLFILVRHFQASFIHKKLCEHHILVRNFSYQADWLRFGLPKSLLEAERLSESLHEVMAEL